MKLLLCLASACFATGVLVGALTPIEMQGAVAALAGALALVGIVLVIWWA